MLFIILNTYFQVKKGKDASHLSLFVYPLWEWVGFRWDLIIDGCFLLASYYHFTL
jgi:hypothetical protein